MCGAERSDGPWILSFAGVDPALEGNREALCALGNGYLGTRGAAPESRADAVHYPGAYLAGVYNRLRSTVDGAAVDNEDMVNLPNWLCLQIRAADGTWFEPPGPATAEHRQELDLRGGILTRMFVHVDGTGRRTRVTQRRFVSMAVRHVAVLETTVRPLDWSGRLVVRSGVDGNVVNDNVAEFRALAKRHLSPISATAAGDTAVVVVETRDSHIRVAVAARTQVRDQTGPTQTEPVREGASYAALELSVTVQQGQDVVIDKVAAVHSSRDRPLIDPERAARETLRRSGGVDSLSADHEQAWARLWTRFGVQVGASPEIARAVNLHLFHLQQSLSPHTIDIDAGVPARGLHGEGYRGHVFWDELFVNPLLGLHLPALARSLLEYRCRRLGAARVAATAAGHRGAMFPWQSAGSGAEETPARLFNARSGRWMPDNSRLQRHVGIAVAYEIWQHYEVTGDDVWLADRGAETLLEIARFLADLTSYDASDDHYDISGVMGPDEFHDGYPGATAPGLRNNAYTNVMTVWVLLHAKALLDRLDRPTCAELRERLGLADSELTTWAAITRRMRVPFLADGVIAQFDGYGDLAEFDWERYRATYGNVGRLDLILAAEGDSTNRYRLSKQPDVLMLLYLLSAEELRDLLSGLGYRLGAEQLLATVEHYAARTTDGSTLSHVVHAWVVARSNRSGSWEHLTHALAADLDDTQGGTTREGIHLGAMAGTIDLLTRCYAGLEARDGVLYFNPQLPIELPTLSFSLTYRGHRLDVGVTAAALTVQSPQGSAAPITIAVAGAVTILAPGTGRTIRIDPGAAHTTALRDTARQAQPRPSTPDQPATVSTGA